MSWKALLVVGLMFASACGGVDAAGRSDTTQSAASTAPSASATAPAVAVEPSLPFTLADAHGDVVTVESIDRIIPLDGDLAEVVFALGLGDRVVATDLSATFPPEADALPEIGYQRSLSAEPIAAFEPTVLLATDLAGPPETLDQLRDLGYPVVMIDRPIDATGPATKIREVAEALGVPERGESLARDVQAEIDAASEAGAAAAAAGDRPRVMALYLRGERVQIVFGKNSGLDWVISAAGAIDVGTELGVVDNAPLTAESVLEAAPDVFLVSTTGLESVGGLDGLLAIPGIAQTPAGEAARVITHPDQYLFGGGPRAGMLLAELVGELHPGTGSDARPHDPTTSTPGD
jgi:iron complex transport system substrate-binding protein